MAIQWGAYSGGYRLGLNFVRTNEYPEYEYWRVEAWVQCYASTYDYSDTFSVSGGVSGSGKLNIAGGKTQYKVWEKTTWWNRQYGSDRKISVSFSVSGVGSGYPPTVSKSFWIGARPYGKPAAPSDVFARYQSDQALAVSASVTSSVSAPVSSVLIDRSADGGSFTRVASVPFSSSVAWTDKGVSAGHFYQYRVSASGSGGTSEPAVSGIVYTTPLAPSNVRAVKSGANIVVSWTNKAAGEYQSLIYEGSDLIATVGKNVSSYTVLSPSPSSAHTYHVTHRAGGLESARVASNSVQLASAPYAPSLLAPNGQYVAAGSAVVLSWRHNSSDTSSQTRCEIQYQHDSGSQWVSITPASGTDSVYTWENPPSSGVVRWRVRTWGQDANKPSPWSETAVFTIITPPTVTIESPADGETVKAASVTVTVSSDDGAQYEVEVSPTPASGQNLYQGIFTDSTANVTVNGLANNTAYTVTARAGSGVWGKVAERTFTVSYPAPPIPDLSAVWDAGSAAAILSYTHRDGVASCDIQRRVHGGVWEIIGAGLAGEGAVTDPTPPLGDDVEYRIVPYSDLGVPAYGLAVPLTASSDFPAPQEGVWLNWGTHFSIVAGLLWNVHYELKPVKEYCQDFFFAGHTMPTVIMGDQSRRSVSVSAYLGSARSGMAGGVNNRDETTLSVVARLRSLAAHTGLVMVRATGQPTIIGYVDSLSVPRDEKNVYTVSMSVMEAQ